MRENVNDEERVEKRKPEKHKDARGQWVAVGLTAGCAIGLIIDSLGMGVAVGLSIGIAMDLAFNPKG